MAEAEDVITDVARHTTVFVRDLWRRRRADAPVTVTLADVTPRLDALLTATFGRRFRLRNAQAPSHTSFLDILLRHDRAPRCRNPVPATDGRNLWLPPDSGLTDTPTAVSLYRAMAFQQAMRAQHGATPLPGDLAPLERDMLLLLEAVAADAALVRTLPGLRPSLVALRRLALARRPSLQRFGRLRRPLEILVREVLSAPPEAPPDAFALQSSTSVNRDRLRTLIRALELCPPDRPEAHLGPVPMFRDWWTGELLAPSTEEGDVVVDGSAGAREDVEHPARAARLRRQPRQRPASKDEDQDQGEGAWMVQVEQPHQHAEDPMGMRRPIDRDQDVDADDFADLVSDLPEARLVSTPGRPPEVLLSDDPPDGKAKTSQARSETGSSVLSYPEWDWRRTGYIEDGARVCLSAAAHGTPEWVAETLQQRRTMLHDVRRRFELLRARQVWLRRQNDGEEIDLDAFVAAFGDYQAGASLPEGLYQTRRRLNRDLAITLLVDISGSTDSWVQGNRRIIDVEREALLVVSHALEALDARWSALAFSGRGPGGVRIRTVKSFDERFDDGSALRISALEPEDYTRAGAAIRHASSALMREAAEQRLLLLLSDGKPNDEDEYNGRYGVEDMRQAVIEARLQGISTFCLTVDRQAAAYLPRIFGTQQYALLARPERLPEVLLDWLRRLIIP